MQPLGQPPTPQDKQSQMYTTYYPILAYLIITSNSVGGNQNNKKHETPSKQTLPLPIKTSDNPNMHQKHPDTRQTAPWSQQKG